MIRAELNPIYSAVCVQLIKMPDKAFVPCWRSFILCMSIRFHQAVAVCWYLYGGTRDTFITVPDSHTDFNRIFNKKTSTVPGGRFWLGFYRLVINNTILVTVFLFLFTVHAILVVDFITTAVFFFSDNFLSKFIRGKKKKKKTWLDFYRGMHGSVHHVGWRKTF